MGPQLKYSHPQDVLTKDTFEAISDYVILGKHLCDRLILVSMEKCQLLSYSVAIENSKYERNCLTFAFGFVLGPLADIDAYGKALTNLVTNFVDLEVRIQVHLPYQDIYGALVGMIMLYIRNSYYIVRWNTSSYFNTAQNRSWQRF